MESLYKEVIYSLQIKNVLNAINKKVELNFSILSMSGQHSLSARYEGGKQIIDIKLAVISWKDNEVFFFYAPALDLTGYGKSEEEARKSMNHQLNEFVTYTMNKGTVYDELERLGWSVNKKKKRLVAPNNEEMLEDNDTYRDLIAGNDYKIESTNMALAL